MNNDRRWLQRLQNFQHAYSVFVRRIEEYEEDHNREAYQMALVQGFEIVIELSWKTIKDYLENEGYDEAKNGKQVLRLAFQAELIHDAEIWMTALQKRNLTSHTYNPEILAETVEFISNQFFPVLRDLYYQMKEWQDSSS